MSAVPDVRDLARRAAVDADRKLNGKQIESADIVPFPPEESDGELAAPGTERITTGDFYAYMPEHRYIFAPDGALWPGVSVNTRCESPKGADGAPLMKQVPRQKPGGETAFKEVPMTPTDWLDQNAPIDQMTWAPGEPLVIRDRLVSSGGWLSRPGCAVFNQYRPPQVAAGHGADVDRWLEHINLVFPNDALHIVRWLAHRVQKPHEKINHALVLGGSQGIGKDTILEPVKHAVGPWNFADVSPAHLLGRFNGFVRSVVLRVSEARDLGDVDRFAFYDHMKIYTASPPDVLRCDEKNIREYSVFNVMGVIITSNHKSDGIYLPADDRRHYVAWSQLTKDDFGADYWNELHRWYDRGGFANVAAYLADVDLTQFDPKAPPPKTAAFWEIVDANRAPEDAPLADVIDALKNPLALTLADLVTFASDDFAEWLRDRKNRRQIPHRLEAAGYVPVRQEGNKDGYWVVNGRRQSVYARSDLPVRDRYAAAVRLTRGDR